jgi:hypothetical protein
MADNIPKAGDAASAGVDPTTTATTTTAATAVPYAGTGAPAIRVEYVADPTKYVQFGNFMLRSFKDTLSTKYNSEEVFGRMDPIMTYQGTGRKIDLGIDLVDADEQNMAQNLAAVSRLMQMQYPVYEQASNALSLSRPPLVRVTFGNYIRGPFGGGLLCAMEGVSYSPFDKYDLAYAPSFVAPEAGAGKHMIPKRISVDFSLVVLHELTPGFADITDKGTIDWIGGDKWAKVDRESGYGGSALGASAGFTREQLAEKMDVDSIPFAEAEKIAETATGE